MFLHAYIKYILLAMFINWALLAVYCRLERQIDLRKFRREHNANIPAISMEIPETRPGIANRVYRFVNAYAYGWMRWNVLLTGMIPSFRIRNLIYRFIFAMQITGKTVIYNGCEFRSPWNIQAGRVTIASNCILDGRREIILEDDVVLGSGVHMWTEEHDMNDPWFRVLPDHRQPIKVKRHAWICSDCTILPGVTVHEGAVTASRACVTKDCESFGVYGGVPARKIAERSRDLKYRQTGKPSWHFL